MRNIPLIFCVCVCVFLCVYVLATTMSGVFVCYLYALWAPKLEKKYIFGSSFLLFLAVFYCPGLAGCNYCFCCCLLLLNTARLFFCSAFTHFLHIKCNKKGGKKHWRLPSMFLYSFLYSCIGYSDLIFKCVFIFFLFYVESLEFTCLIVAKILTLILLHEPLTLRKTGVKIRSRQ